MRQMAHDNQISNVTGYDYVHALGDLGYETESDTITVGFKKRVAG